MHALQLKSAKLAEFLSAHSAEEPTEVSSSASQTTYAATNAPLIRPKIKLGKDIVEDFKTVSIGQSAYFTGVLLSTTPTAYPSSCTW